MARKMVLALGLSIAFSSTLAFAQKPGDDQKGPIASAINNAPRKEAVVAGADDWHTKVECDEAILEAIAKRVKNDEIKSGWFTLLRDKKKIQCFYPKWQKNEAFGGNAAQAATKTFPAAFDRFLEGVDQALGDDSSWARSIRDYLNRMAGIVISGCDSEQGCTDHVWWRIESDQRLSFRLVVGSDFALQAMKSESEVTWDPKNFDQDFAKGPEDYSKDPGPYFDY